MSACPSCKAAGYVEGAPCPRCGYSTALASHPSLELDIPKAASSKPRAPPKKKEEEIAIELAVDMNEVRPVAPTTVSSGPHISVPPNSSRSLAPHARSSLAPHGSHPPGRTAHMSGAPLRPHHLESDDEIEARTLAAYGEAPDGALKAPFYAYRVYKRRKELEGVLAGRREEAKLAATRAEDALVALGERTRAAAANDPGSARALQALKDAEELMRSRDHSLAREQDAHAERLRSIDQRIGGAEAELVAAQAAERKASEELVDAQGTLQRAEARLKRAEIELRNQAVARAKVTR
jgi:hypothetical protein